MNGADLELDYLAGLPEDELRRYFRPYQQEMDLLERQRAQAEALGGPRAGKHVSTTGAILGGLGNLGAALASGYAGQGLQGQQQALLGQMQGEAAGRTGDYAKWLQGQRGAGGAGAAMGVGGMGGGMGAGARGLGLGQLQMDPALLSMLFGLG